MSYYAIGVDLGGTNLRVAAVDEGGKLLAKTTLHTEVSQGREHVIDELCRATSSMVQDMRQQQQDGCALCGIGVGVPGLVDSESGQLLDSPNLPGWSNYDVKGEIERRLGTAVILENDANAAALGEQWLGAGRDFESMCMYTLGTGVGGGLVLNGEIWRGWNGMGGELGHCNVEPEGHACKCGSYGCLEQYASATAVVRMTREALAGGAASELRQVADEALTAQVVYEQAMRGDGVAKQVYERVGRALGLAIANMVNTLNLPLYVIGGGVSSAWDAFAPALFAEVRGRSFVYAWTTGEDGKGVGGRRRATRITRALLGGDGGLYGAARLPMLHAAVTSKV
jgi:glucokinase